MNDEKRNHQYQLLVRNFVKTATPEKKRSDYYSVRSGKDLGGHELTQSKEEGPHHEDPVRHHLFPRSG